MNLLYGLRSFAEFPFVLSQFTRSTDRQTDISAMAYGLHRRA